MRPNYLFCYVNQEIWLIVYETDGQARGQWIQLLGNLLWPGQTNHKKESEGTQRRPKKAFYDPIFALNESVQ